MDLLQSLKNNPTVSLSSALELITQQTIVTFGLSYPETLDDAKARIRKHLYSIFLSEIKLSKHLLRPFHFEGSVYYAEPKEDEIYRGEFCPDNSTVNIIQFIDIYNSDLISNGNEPIFRELNPELSSNIVNISELSKLILSITDIVSNIVLRDGTITTETFNAIIVENTHSISDTNIKALIPDLCAFLRDKLDLKIAKGRITSVTDKKIKGAIWLADRYKEKIPNEAILVKEIHDSSLSKPDKEHVAKVFTAYRNG